MKKLINILVIILITISSSHILVNAESMQIKKIDDEYALLENGFLVKAINPKHEYGITPNTKSEIVAENVMDFHIEHVALSKRITVLKNDGTLISRMGDKEEKVIDSNVSQMISDDIYLKNRTIYSLRDKYTYDNIKKIFDARYALDVNDTLYACVNGKKIKIAENVLDYKNELIFNKNNEILSFDIDINNGTTQLNLLTNEVSYENFIAGESITNDNKIITYKNNKSIILDEPQKVKRKVSSHDNTYIYYLSTDNKLMLYNKYYYNYPISSKYGKIRELYDGETFKVAFSDFAIGTNNNLYRLSLSNNSKKTIDSDVDKILLEKSSSYTNSSYIIYQKINGDIYYYSDEYKKPFLYPLSQKQTKVLLNGKNIQLEENIQIRDGRSMYPFRAILEAMGATVMWDANNGIAIGTLNNIRVGFKIGTNEYTINGEVKYMDTESYIDTLTERTYIPIRYMAEAFGYSVDWNAGEKENIITISKAENVVRYRTVDYDIQKNQIKEDKNLNISSFKPFMGLTKTMLDTSGTPSETGIDTTIDAFSFFTSWFDNSLEITKLHVTIGNDNTISIKYGEALEKNYSGKEETLESLLINKYYNVKPSIVFTSGDMADEYIRNWFNLSGDGKYSMKFNFGKVHNSDYGYYLMIDGENIYQVPIIHNDTTMNVYYTIDKETTLLFDASKILRNTKIKLADTEKETILKILNENGYIF